MHVFSFLPPSPTGSVSSLMSLLRTYRDPCIITVVFNSVVFFLTSIRMQHMCNACLSKQLASLCQ